MLINMNRIMGAICPECSNAVISHVSAFSFSGARSVLIKCPTKGCGHEFINVSLKGKKFKISVRCPFCGDIHNFTIDANKLWSRDLSVFRCGETGLGIFFFGVPEKVESSLSETLIGFEKMYDDIMGEFDDFDEDYEDGEDDILYDIIDELHSLHRKGVLSCICGNESLSVSTADGKILLSCPRCRRSKLLPADESTLSMVINATAIILGR